MVNCLSICFSFLFPRIGHFSLINYSDHYLNLTKIFSFIAVDLENLKPPTMEGLDTLLAVSILSLNFYFSFYFYASSYSFM